MTVAHCCCTLIGIEGRCGGASLNKDYKHSSFDNAWGTGEILKMARRQPRQTLHQMTPRGGMHAKTWARLLPNRHSWCRSHTVKAICHAGPRFPCALVARIVITSKCSIIVSVNIGLGALCIPAAGATTHARTHTQHPTLRETWIPAIEAIEMREYRARREGIQSEGSTSEQVKFSIAPSLWEPSICPSPVFPSTSSSISRYGGAPAALFTGSYFLMRVDEGRGQDSTAATAESPLSAPLIPCVVSRYTSVHYRGAGGAARSLWAGAQPANQPRKPYGRSGTVWRTGKSCVGCLLFLLYTVQCWEIISFVGKGPSLSTLPPSIASVYVYLAIIAEPTFLPSRRYPHVMGANACCLCSV